MLQPATEVYSSHYVDNYPTYSIAYKLYAGDEYYTPYGNKWFNTVQEAKNWIGKNYPLSSEMGIEWVIIRNF